MKERKKGERVLIFDYTLKRLLRNKGHYGVMEGFLSERLMRDLSVKAIGKGGGDREHAKDRMQRYTLCG
jgi:hypothetical protein